MDEQTYPDNLIEQQAPYDSEPPESMMCVYAGPDFWNPPTEEELSSRGANPDSAAEIESASGAGLDPAAEKRNETPVITDESASADEHNETPIITDEPQS